MEQNTNPKMSSKVKDRITLNKNAATMLELWMGKLKAAQPELNLSRSELVSWIIERHGPELSQRELGSIRDSHFDEIGLAKWALKKLQQAKERGEQLTLHELIRGQSVSKQPRTRSKKSTGLQPEVPEK